MLLSAFALLAASVATANAQTTCAASAQLGPCLTDNSCPNAGATCIGGNCCSSGSSTSTSTNSSCVDLLNPVTGTSDCPSRSSLCTNSVYLTVMQQQCPKTCGFCSSTSTSTNSTGTTSCVDLLNPNTGVSDCPSRAYLCTNSIYQTLMATQCPATCGKCSGK